MGITETLVKKYKKVVSCIKSCLCTFKEKIIKLHKKIVKCITTFLRTLKEKIIRNRKKIGIGTGIFLCTLLVIYLGMAAYFINHFYFGSEINGISVSGKSVKKVNELMASELQTYKLEIKERGGKNEEITADDIGLRYNSDGDFGYLKDTQNPLKWVSALCNDEASKMVDETDFDKAKLKEKVNKLSCLNKSNMVEPKNAGLKYSNNEYVIVDEVAGSKIDKDALYKNVEEAVLKEETSIDLEAVDCYVKPEYTSKSEKVKEAKDTLDKYISAKVIYTFGDKKETLDGDIINTWLAVNKNFEVTFDEAKAKKYIDSLASTYNTVGKARSFVTSSGNTINVSGGDYGWAINKDKEKQVLIEAVKEGQMITREPSYSQTALSRTANDIGNTYVEVDLSKQHLWYYKNGTLVTQGDVVTGNVSKGHSTPAGVYKLKYKEKNAVLDGPGYSQPVTYWMPFNGGIGIHDASWRDTYGGSIYKTNGSHGCVNSPFNLAKTIFENIQAGVPVVLY